MSVHLQLRGQPGVLQRLTDLSQTYLEALAVASRRRPRVPPVTPVRSPTNSSSSRAQGARGE